MNLPRQAAFLVGLAVLLLSATQAGAQMYRWTDDQGGVHYTQGLDSVPDRLRPKAQMMVFPERPAAPAPTRRIAGRCSGQYRTRSRRRPTAAPGGLVNDHLVGPSHRIVREPNPMDGREKVCARR